MKSAFHHLSSRPSRSGSAGPVPSHRARRALLHGLAALLLGAFSLAHGAPPTDAEVKTRSEALEVAGAFSNDGFKIRDGHWNATVSKEKPALIQVNLYAGNQYWFIVAATGEAKKIAVSVYDENGVLQESEPYENGHQAAAGFSPDVSGPYYIKVEELEGDPAAFCLIYSYK